MSAEMRSAPLRGRQAQAARNDKAILTAAREVFLADPTAPISTVAERAGVGIGALYHRYAGKEDLLRTLCQQGQEIYVAEIEQALSGDREPWEAFVNYLRRIVAANTHGLTVRLAGTFTATAAARPAPYLGRADRAMGEALTQVPGVLHIDGTPGQVIIAWLLPPSATPPGSGDEHPPGRRHGARPAPAVPGRLTLHRPRSG
jgi:AcrR family transcriptional regulator